MFFTCVSADIIPGPFFSKHRYSRFTFGLLAEKKTNHCFAPKFTILSGGARPIKLFQNSGSAFEMLYCIISNSSRLGFVN